MHPQSAIILFRTPNCSNILAQSRRPGGTTMVTPWIAAAKSTGNPVARMIPTPLFSSGSFFGSLPTPCVVGIDVRSSAHSTQDSTGRWKNMGFLLYQGTCATPRHTSHIRGYLAGGSAWCSGRQYRVCLYPPMIGTPECFWDPYRWMFSNSGA